MSEQTSSEAPQPAVVVLPDKLAGERRRARAPGRLALFALGVLLILMLVVALVVARTNGTETRTISPPTSTSTTSYTTTVPRCVPCRSTPRAGSGSTTTATGGTSKTTTKGMPSEAVLLSLLGTGAILVLAGALYNRLSAIKLPGGAEITLTPEEREQVAAKVAEKAGAGADPEAVARATAAALPLAHATKLVTGVALREPEIDQAAAVGVESMQAERPGDARS